MTNYCRPLVAGTRASIEVLLKESLEEFPYIEIWLGGVADASPEWAAKLSECYPKRLLYVLRKPGIPQQALDPVVVEGYLALLRDAPCLVDIDLLQADEIENINFFGQGQLLLSLHDFSGTPSIAELRSAHTRMLSLQPSIVKFSTLAASQQDALRLVQFLAELRGRYNNAVVIGMGQAGQIVRILSAFFGAPLVYAPKNKSEVNAPGQLTRMELEQVLRMLADGVSSFGYV